MPNSSRPRMPAKNKTDHKPLSPAAWTAIAVIAGAIFSCFATVATATVPEVGQTVRQFLQKSPEPTVYATVMITTTPELSPVLSATSLPALTPTLTLIPIPTNRMIDEMCAIGWKEYSIAGAIISTSVVPAGNENTAIKVQFHLPESKWVGIAKEVCPGVLAGAQGIQFSYKGNGAPNTLEFKMITNQGTVFSKLWGRATSTTDWVTKEIPYTEFACWKDTPGCMHGDEKLTPEEVLRVDFAFSNKPGDEPGSGEVVINDLMVVP